MIYLTIDVKFANIANCRDCVIFVSPKGGSMNVEFEKEYLAELYETGKTDDKKHRFQPQIINGYLKCIKALPLQSFRPYHPGELVKEELECRGIRQKDFAKKFGLSYPALNETLNAKRPITTEFALFLEAALGVNADLLVRMQTDYNIQMARKNNSLREKLNNIKKIAAVF